MTWQCGEVTSANQITTGMFLAKELSEWICYRRAYCSPACRDFRGHVLGSVEGAMRKAHRESVERVEARKAYAEQQAAILRVLFNPGLRVI